MKSPTKRIFYHFGVYALYLAPFWLHFGIVGTVGGSFCCSKDISKNFREINFKKSHSDKTFYHLQ